MAPEQYVTVSALTKYIKKKMELDPHLQTVYLKGEISNFKHHSRGHMYMTIKDEKTQIRAVMFAGDNRNLKFIPENGMKVLIKGDVSVFEPYGSYQLYIRNIEPDGVGSLFLAYEQLKDKLFTQGYFNQEHKKDIIAFPKHIAVITSPTGAAIRDIITTIRRRFPIVQLTIIPVIVQGDSSIQSIIHGINKANNIGNFDTIILGRGGGSIEDLWAFNDEKVAMAIFHSKIPIISGIGHETDFTISDFISDLRAPTPTGAAELAVPSLLEIQTTIQQYRSRIIRFSEYTISAHKNHLEVIKQSHAFQKPTQFLKEKEQYIDRVSDKMDFLVKQNIQQRLHQLGHLSIRFDHVNPVQKYRASKENVIELTKLHNKSYLQLMQSKKHELQILIHKLSILNPLEIMKRGFSVALTENGEIITSTEDLKKNDSISVQMIDGTLDCSIKKIWRDNTHVRKK